MAPSGQRVMARVRSAFDPKPTLPMRLPLTLKPDGGTLELHQMRPIQEAQNGLSPAVAKS
jgi:hypothetical protein